MNLKDRLLKNSTIKESASLLESKVFEKKDLLTTEIPALNIALTGSIDGGMPPGILQIAGKSKHFKSKFGLIMAETFLKKFPEGAVLFYDSEFGTPESYFSEFNTENIIHCPVVDLDQLNHDIVKQINQIVVGEKLLILIDSLGNLASLKEVKDALEGNGTVDMTRAKKIRSLFRMIGPRVNLKDIYVVVINQTYDPMDQYKPEVLSGGGGTIYNSNIIWIISKAQNKDSDKELLGYHFTIRCEKSRFIQENSKIPITVSFEEGIEKWSGMLDLAEEAGYIIKPTKQSYALKDKPEETYKRRDIENSDEFWATLFKETDFSKWIEENFRYK